MSERIKIAIAGIGNCASSLVQGIHFYRQNRTELGLMNPTIGQWGAGDIEVVCAFDIDKRKVNEPLERAIFALPNNTQVFFPEIPPSQTIVRMGNVLDGVAEHLAQYPPEMRFDPSTEAACDVVKALRESGAEILVSYMPVGSQQATEFYARAAIEAGLGYINCVPCFVVSDPAWARKFAAAGLPCIGDDIKAQLGATITHRTLAKLFDDRGVKISSTYQLNTGGNTDFLNMLDRKRLASKKLSKTDAVQSQLQVPIDAGHIHIGPSDFVAFQKDNKVCFLRIEGIGFGGVPMNLELRLSVEDSPNSAAVVIDAIRCCKLALDAGVSGPLEAVSAWTMKHPPKQMADSDARQAVAEFISQRARPSA